MIKLYMTNIGKLPDPHKCPDIMEDLTKERRDRILRSKSEKARKQSLGAGLLLKHVLENYGLSQENITYGENGKPEIKGLYFNLSHSGDVVICAAGDAEVGCDIEAIADVKEGVADRFFTQNEILYLKGFDGEQKRTEFFRLWTIKESYMKLTGEGMSLSLGDFDVKIGNTITIERRGMVCPCFVKEYHLEGYKIAVCANGEDFAEEIEIFE